MPNFINQVKNILDEQNKTVNDLFINKIISENTFYKYNQRMPSLKTLFNIANYLKVSINYLFELTDINNFVEYDIKNILFYNNLNMFIKSKNI